MNQEALEQRVAALEAIIANMLEQIEENADSISSLNSFLEDLGIVEGFKPPWAQR